jgi:hypothetical protein
MEQFIITLLKIIFGEPMTNPTQQDAYPDIAGFQYPLWAG